MARVIYTGPLNQVIFARAKKEAEKAERIKGYRPRVIKTPTHTVVYNKTGAEVKAVVMDMLAPITFSIPGSAIPVAPSFLHLHPELPENVYGRENYAAAEGDIRGWDVYAYIEEGVEINESVSYIHRFGLNEVNLSDFVDRFWDYNNGYSPPTGHVKTANWPMRQEVVEVQSTGSVSAYKTNRLTFCNVSFSGSHIDRKEITNAELSYVGTYWLNYFYKRDTEFNYSSVVSCVFHGSDIRFSYKDGFKNINTKSIACTSARFTSKSHGFNYHRGDYGASESVFAFNEFTQINQELVTISATGSLLFPAVSGLHDWTRARDISRKENENGVINTIGSEDRRSNIQQCVIENLTEFIYQFESLSDDISHDITEAVYSPFDKVNKNTLFNAHVYVAGSVVDGRFTGIAVRAKLYDAYTKTTNIKHKHTGKFEDSHLSYYFDLLNGVYMFNDAPFWMPPKITTDGICLPHAWFFVRGNETRQTDFYPNNHNRLSIVIYPQGRHEFSVDEAEIVSVELNHTPRFVARPGGGIAFVMQSLFGGNKLVPYVVNGLVEERDERGEPTGFYLAQDGAISGEFKAHPNGGSNPFASFKLSPRQVFDGYRTVTVETTTEREYGVQTTFEVQGSGGVRVQQPPSITLERINESVLAGQSTVFYVTATQIAVGSNLRYEIKRAGTVVSAGYIELGNCAGWVEFIAQFRSVAVPGDPVRYVLGDKSAPSTTPSTVEFEFGLVHEQAPPPVTFSVKFAHELYASSTDRPAALPMPPLFFLQPLVSENGEDDFIAANYQTTLINRIYYSLQSKRVYVLFWDGQSCDVSGILKKNQESGQYEYNPDWKETSFDYPPAVDPYNIKGTLEPYVYAYMDYENNRNNGA